MAPNEQAQKTHEALFPAHVSTLTVTDPELIEPATRSGSSACSARSPATNC